MQTTQPILKLLANIITSLSCFRDIAVSHKTQHSIGVKCATFHLPCYSGLEIFSFDEKSYRMRIYNDK